MDLEYDIDITMETDDLDDWIEYNPWYILVIYSLILAILVLAMR